MATPQSFNEYRKLSRIWQDLLNINKSQKIIITQKPQGRDKVCRGHQQAAELQSLYALHRI